MCLLDAADFQIIKRQCICVFARNDVILQELLSICHLCESMMWLKGLKVNKPELLLLNQFNKVNYSYYQKHVPLLSSTNPALEQNCKVNNSELTLPVTCSIINLIYIMC